MYKDLTITEELKNCHSLEDIKKIYPHIKSVGGKSSHTFFQLSNNLYCKVYYRLHTGESMKNIFSCLIGDINYKLFDVDKLYTEI